MNQRRQWQARTTGMSQDPYQFFPSSQFNQQQNPGTPWKNQPPFSTWPSQPLSMPPLATSILSRKRLAKFFFLSSILAKNPYSSQWPASTSQNPNWSQNKQRPLGITNSPMGTSPQCQPTLPAPYPLSLNSQPPIRPQLPA